MNNQDVFINCPFSEDFKPFFHAMVFAVVRSGFTPRCALEADDSSENRFDKICQIIKQCDYGIHDISKIELDEKSALPRFNMPLELGLFLAAKKFGNATQRRKKCIIFESRPYEYQKFISDIAGQDIHCHHKSLPKLFIELSAWMRRENEDGMVPGGNTIKKEHQKFQKAVPRLCRKIGLQTSEMTYLDYRRMVEKWAVSSIVP